MVTARFSKRIRALTLVECLVCIAIIGILAAIVLPTMIRARRSAFLTDDISRMRQFGVAAQMYMDSNPNGGTLGHLKPLLDQDLVPHSLTYSPLDPTSRGWVNSFLEYQSKTIPQARQRIYTYPQSYFGFHDLFPSVYDIETFKQKPGAPGWLVAVSPNTEMNPSVPFAMLGGPIFRLTFDGAVVRRTPPKRKDITYIAAFRDLTEKELNEGSK